ncbi:hypothetical protein C0995_001898 [Termitomyces sp. Mi166|nr:hypothetical protein C0995_001898 [Termitomyces sp. Mi166\
MQVVLLFLLYSLHLSYASILRTRPRTGVTIPLTKRAQGMLQNKDGVVDKQALRSALLRVNSKMQRGFHAYQKNMGTFHPSDPKLSTKRETGSLELTDDNGALWFGTIQVGNPPVKYTVDFDTGSSDLFLPGTGCSTSCEGHTRYDPSKSTTAKDIGHKFLLSYGDGSTVQGDIFTDTVKIANMTATTQAVGSATSYSTGFSKAQFSPDGLMGMAFPQISEFNANPVFQTLVAQKKTTAPQFSFKLSESGSELYLGGTDSELYTGTLSQAPVVQQGFWQVDLDAVNVGGKPTRTGLSAIIDTGTTLVFGDLNSVKSLYAAIPGAADASSTIGSGFFSFPCDSSPDVSLTFAGKAFSISPDTFNLGRLSASSPDCVGGIAATEIWIVGDVFLQNVYTVFDAGNSSDPGTGIQPFLTPVPPLGSDLLAEVTLPLQYAIGTVRTVLVLTLLLLYVALVSGVCALFAPIPPLYRIASHFFTAVIARAVLLVLGFFWISAEQVQRKRGFNPIFVLPVSEPLPKSTSSSNPSAPIIHTPGRRIGIGSANIQSPRKAVNLPVAVLGFQPVSLLTIVGLTGQVPPFGSLGSNSKPTLSFESLRKSADRPIVVFPECTTSNGRGLLRFAQVFRQEVPVKKYQVFVMCVRYDPPTTTRPTPTLSIPSPSLNPLPHLFSLASSVVPPIISIRLLAPSESPSSPLFVVSEIITDFASHDDQLTEVSAVLISQLGKMKRMGMGWEDKASFLDFYKDKRKQ